MRGACDPRVVRPAMLCVRAEQLRPFVQDRRVEFERDAAKHLLLHFASSFDPPDSVIAFVRYGIHRARLYDLHHAADVVLYLDVMVVLGSRFDEEPQRRWAWQHLHDEARAPSLRIRRMFAAVLAHMEPS
jgi:hypothetical protein